MISSMSHSCLSDHLLTVSNTKLPPENDVGNIEYKRKLVDPTPNRFEHLVTQMKWRLNEGRGEAIYHLGVDDDGRVSGLAPNELNNSLTTLERMARRLNATLHPLRERTIDGPTAMMDAEQLRSCGGPIRKAVELLVRQSPMKNHGRPDMCIAVLGGMDAGKSTLIGVLTGGELDNARGRARLNLFRHLHEVQSGRTSCMSRELLGFDANRVVTNYSHPDGRLTRASIDELVRNSIQLVTLLDFAGYSKYQRTTLAGIARTQPVGVLLVVSVTNGLTPISLEHAQLAFGLGLPVAVVVSKIDQIVNEADRKRQVTAVCRQIVTQLGLFNEHVPANHQGHVTSTQLQPLFFPVSAVTGEGIPKLLQFLGHLGRDVTTAQLIESPHSLPSTSADFSFGSRKEQLFLSTVSQSLTKALQPSCSTLVRFDVAEVFACVRGVPDPVLFGFVRSGQIANGDLLWLGPDQAGRFHLVQIMSLYHDRQPHSVVFAGQTASVAVRFLHAASRRISKSGSAFFNTSLQVGNEENHPSNLASNLSLELDHISPIGLRRGMILIAATTWANPSSSLLLMQSSANLPCCLPFLSTEFVGITKVVEVEITHRLPIFPNLPPAPLVIPRLPVVKQKVAFHCGCITQTVTVISTELPSSNSNHLPRLTLRFLRYPEYLKYGSQIILTWAGCAKAIGRLVGLPASIRWTDNDEHSHYITPSGDIHPWVNTSMTDGSDTKLDVEIADGSLFGSTTNPPTPSEYQLTSTYSVPQSTRLPPLESLLEGSTSSEVKSHRNTDIGCARTPAPLRFPHPNRFQSHRRQHRRKRTPLNEP